MMNTPPMTHFAAIFALALVLLNGSAKAADADGLFMVEGAGGSSCERYGQAVAARDAAFIAYAGWIDGYLSAFNRYEQGVFDITAWQGTEILMAFQARKGVKETGNPDQLTLASLLQ